MPRTILSLILLAAVVLPARAQDEPAPPTAPEPPADAAPAPPPPAPPPPPEAAEALGPGVPAFTVRPGYRVTLASKPGLVRDARFMAAGPKRTLFVAERTQGAIALLRDEDRDGVYESAVTFIDGRPDVHALQFNRGWLYFSTPNAIERARDTDGDLVADDIETVVEGLEGGGGHDWRALLVTRNFLFTAIGDSGNITDETMSDRQKVWRYSLDGGGKALWASGIRNTEELQVRPGTSELWGVDHGSDWFGRPLGEGEDGGDAATAAQPVTDLHPPDEFNRYELGGFYGHPFITAPRIPRYEFAQRPDLLEIAAKAIPPQWLFGAHWAANGWTFLNHRNAHFPPDHRRDAFVACHGSWNRTEPAGYRVERVLFDQWTGRPYGSQLIVSTLGGESGRDVLARPVDVIEAPGGTLLFSSDAPEHVIYRIEWAAAAATPQAVPSPEEGEPDAPANGDDVQ